MSGVNIPTPTESSPLPAAGQAWLRDNNLATLTQALFAATEEVSRVDLADETGLTRATVSRLVDHLVDAGIAEKLPPVRLPQQGRPASPIRPAAGKVVGVGLEVNVDYIAGRAIDLTGRSLSEFEIGGSFANSDPAAVISHLGEMARGTIRGLQISGASVAGVCLAIPGIVSSDDGHLLGAPNLGWQDIPLLQLLREQLADFDGLEVSVANDANLQGSLAAHTRPGKLREDSTFIYLVGDRGIGGAIVIDGTPNTGELGWAGEIGHMCIDMNGPLCFCGSNGCLERYAGVSAMLSNAGLDPSASISDLEGLLEAGNQKALQAVDTARNALAMALANTVNLLDVPQVILGTSLGRLLPWFEPRLSELTNSLVVGRRVRPVQISSARGPSLPACTGGAYSHLQSVIDDPAAWISQQERGD